MIRHSPVSKAVRVVGLLAFGQSVVFLIAWLLICAVAGAGEAKPVQAKNGPVSYAVTLSTYQPTSDRDPFSRKATGTDSMAAGIASGFQLEGILFEKNNPSAIVSGHLVTKGKPTNFGDGQNKLVVTPVEITKDKVVLEYAGQRTELRLPAGNSAAAAKP